MLHLKTAAGERLEVPAYAIIAVMKPCDGVNPSAIIFDMGEGPQIDQLGDQYGFVKKLVNDAQAMVNPVEVRILELVAIDGEQVGYREGRMFFSRDRIVGRREVKDSANGICAKLFVDLLGKPTAISIADTLDELDGVEAEPATPVAMPVLTQGE
ncbi:hypothetical protein TomMM35A_18730 [Sphingobium sp. TomMM35A]